MPPTWPTTTPMVPRRPRPTAKGNCGRMPARVRSLTDLLHRREFYAFAVALSRVPPGEPGRTFSDRLASD
jgi:hypothetical protein